MARKWERTVFRTQIEAITIELRENFAPNRALIEYYEYFNSLEWNGNPRSIVV